MMSPEKPEYVSDLVVYLLNRLGVEYVTLNIGATGPLDSAHRRPWIDWVHTAQVQGQIVRDYVKWDDQPQGALSVAESILRAYQIAMTDPKGPVYLCFDVELQESPLPADLQLPDLAYYRPPAAPAG